MAKGTARKAKELKDIDETTAIKCVMCGGSYPSQERNFPRSYSPLWFGNGYFAPICKNCIVKLFKHYMVELNDVKAAFERVCSKLDFYYHPHMFDAIFEKGGVDGVWGEYYKQINHMQWGTGKYTYDTTLEKRAQESEPEEEGVDVFEELKHEKEREKDIKIPLKTIKFWGEGYSPAEYKWLDDEYSSWVIRANNGERPSKALESTLKEMCATQLDIKRARIAGVKPNELSQLQTTHMKLMERAGLSPNQEDSNNLAEKNALGVLIDVWETTEPVPTYPEENKIKNYIDIWFKGHLARAANLKNDTQDDYNAEMEKYKVKILGNGEEKENIESGETDG